ncbi:MAG: peptidoglycan DD-metalloendopeptidase family protein [Bacteroidota bacterium]
MQSQTRISSYLTGLFLMLTVFAYSADRYWIAAGSASWNNTANWSTTSGGAGGASVPGSGDIANFNGSGTGSCTVDAAVNVAGFIVAGGYTGTISQGVNTVTIGTSNASFAAGTFTGGSSSITINGTFTLSGTAFTSTSNTLTFNSTVTNSSGTFTHNSGTVSFSSTGAQTIPAWNFYNLTSASTGTRTLNSTGTIGISNTFTKGTNTYTNTGSTINYNGTGAQTIVAFNYNHLTISGAHGANNITLANSGTIGIAGTFSNTATFSGGAFVITGSTVSYNGTGAQTVIAFNYNHITITGAHTTNNITLANSGTIGIAGTFTNSATFTSGAFVNTGSTINYNGTGAQTVIAFRYNNLTLSGSRTTNSITISSTGVIRVAAAFTNSAAFTSGSVVATNSTVEYNGTGAQTVIALNYHNLTITGAHGANNVTLASSGTIGIAKAFLPLATFTSGAYVSTSGTVDYNGTLPQVISAFPYNNLTGSSTGARSFSSTGTIKIAGTFTKGTNTYTNIGSTGEGYTPQTNLNNTSLVGASVVSTSTAFVSGIGGIIYKTTDGGTNWTLQTSNTTNDLYALKFHDSNTGLAVGNSGTIDRTTNGGTTWGTVTSGTAEHLRAVTFASSTVAFAGGVNGVIRKSTDGGATWASTTTGTTQAIYGITFVDINTGYACGWNGTIIKTTNGGSNWSTLTSGVTDQLTSVKFTSPTTGIAVGTNGRILKTTNAGTTWTNITSGTSDHLNSVAFYDVNNGYIIGGNITNNTSTVLKTTDGGTTWTIFTIGYNRLTAMEIFDQTTGYIAGLDGHIVKYTCCSNGSIADFNGTGAQTAPAFNYHSLTLSGARTTNNITLASSGTIGVSGTITKTATFTSGSIVVTGSTVDLNGTQAQTVPVFTFNNLTTNSTGKKSVTGNVTVNGTLNLVSGELALAGNTLTMASNSYNVVTKTSGYVSTTGSGKLSRPTASVSAYLFPMGYRSTNDSADYFSFSLTPGKTSAQNFEGALNSNSTGFVVTHDKTLHGAVSSKVTVSVSSSSYNALQLEYDINTSADISAVRVTDQNDNTLKTLNASLYTITGGNQLNILNVYQLCLVYSKTTINSNLNWEYEISYDGNGIPVSEQIQYIDLLGRPTQAQVRNIADNTVLATQTVYDNYGRAALQTLPAPIGSVMAYQNKFITNSSGNAYTYTDFDKPATTNNYPGEVNNPSTVSSSSPGTLGWYYSNNNTLEPYQAATSYPYSRKELTGAGRSAAPGDEYRMGAGHESKGYSMVSGTELKFIFGTDKSYKDTITTADKMVNNALTITGGIQASKNISIDADGKEVISYDVGGLPIASCYTGITGACTMTTVTNTMVYTGTGSTDIHLPSANKSSLKLNLPAYYCDGIYGGTVGASDITFKITDVATNKVLALTTDYTVHATTRVVTFLGGYATGSSVFRISFVYSQSIINTITAGGCTIPDVTVTYDLDYSRWSVNYYDLAGRLRKSVSQKGINCSSAGTINFATTYDYSSMGQLIASKSADEGLKEMVYDAEGKLRFIQNAVQEAADKFSYINYDAHARPVESGEYTTSNTDGSIFFRNYYGAYSAPYAGNDPSTYIINNTGNTGMPGADCGDINNIHYYPLAGAEDISGSYTYKSSYTPRYTMGKICKTENANSATWYGYNQAGQTVFTVQQMLDNDYTTYKTALNDQIKTVDYTYAAANGTLSDQTYQKNVTAEKLKHVFTYDASLRLTEVKAAIESGGEVTQAKYFYSKTGALERKELGDKLQGIDYIYTVNGQLKSINNPSLNENEDPGQDGKTGSANAAFGKDVFGLALDYYSNDYVRTGTYVRTSTSSIFNGMMSAQRHKTRSLNNSVDRANSIYGAGMDSLLITATTDEIMRKYTYDVENRLSIAVFGKYTNDNNVFTVIKAYKEWGASSVNGIGYDDNGNITSLKRNAFNGTAGITMDDFTYTYTSNTNKLASNTDGVSAGAYGTDFDASSFTYNTNGQMTVSTAENVTAITYYHTVLTKKVSYSNPATSFAEYWYDDRGKKIKTKYYSGTNSKFIWYVNDAAGNVLAIYEYDQAETPTPTFRLTEQPLYGSGRIGTLDKVSGVIDYELTDHLGNVRATIKGTAQGVYVITSWTDYYAFGGVMPGRSYNQNTYRYNYQGQESAVSSNWQNFELRMHNSDLGRWFAPDPYGQFHSPYISMGNNPVSGIDPDGGRALAPISDGQPAMNRWANYMDEGYGSAYEMYMAEHWGVGGLSPLNDFGKGTIGGGGGSWDWMSKGYGINASDVGGEIDTDAFGNSIGWDINFSGSDLVTTYVVTDNRGNEHISFTQSGADNLKAQYDFHYDGMIRSDGVDMGGMFYADALNLPTNANTFYTGVGLTIKNSSTITVERILTSPVGNATITSEFMSQRTCPECSPTHGGTDYGVPEGTRVVATASGTVERAYKSSTYGNAVIVNHGPSKRGKGNVYTLYGHGKSLNVKQGQKVKTGDLLLYSGNTGKSTGPHLHYEVIVTPATPFQPAFFSNLKIRFGPKELGYFLQ